MTPKKQSWWRLFTSLSSLVVTGILEYFSRVFTTWVPSSRSTTTLQSICFITNTFSTQFKNHKYDINNILLFSLELSSFFFFLNTEILQNQGQEKNSLHFAEFIQVYYLFLPCGTVISALGKMMKEKNWAQGILRKWGQTCFSRGPLGESGRQEQWTESRLFSINAV